MKQPNILFILTDDHAAHAISAYGSRINQTPNLDRIAATGLRFDNCFCTNSICTPSRAAILTGTFNHVNRVTTLVTHLDNRIPTFPGLLREQGYRTGVFGKWHLGEDTGSLPNNTHFDQWAVLPGQGIYHNPEFLFQDGGRRTVRGYATDIITDMSLEFLQGNPSDQPFCLLCWHKAPHRPWEPDEKHMSMFSDGSLPEPETLLDDYAHRSAFAAAARMRVGRDMNFEDLKCHINKTLPESELRRWAYQRYIKDYLRVVASIDDNVGRLLDYLEATGQRENTIIVYSSDQGFFLGDHGWFDKRFMYEESFRMPLLVSYPQRFRAGSAVHQLVDNVDFAPTLLSLCGAPVPPHLQGSDMTPLMLGESPENWKQSVYYRYWMNGATHSVAAHYGVRTRRYKLIYYYNAGLGQPGTDGYQCDNPDSHGPLAGMQPEWELFDLERDPQELMNRYADPDYADVVDQLKAELVQWQRRIGDDPVTQIG